MCICVKCGREIKVAKSSLLTGHTTQCKLCNVRQGHETFQKRLWGGKVPDSFDRYLKLKWNAIKRRCEDPTCKTYARYGGRGISLSNEFQDPRVFVEYVKSLPNASRKLQIDRIDNNRGYERGNLRWVTNQVNANNRECTRYIEYRGLKIPLIEFVREFTDLSYEYVKNLLKEGNSPDEIVSWNKHHKNVVYNGKSMSLRSFALRFTDMTPTNVRKLYLRGVPLDEIASWKKRAAERFMFNGESLTFPQFVKKYTKVSLQCARSLKRKGKSLDDISKWRVRSDVITYKGVKMHFKDFVRRHTDMSYTYARQLYRHGKSIDEIAEWRCDPSLRRNKRRPEA